MHDFDERGAEVLERFHARMREEAATPRTGDWQDRSLLSVGPETGAFLAIVARSLFRPRILEIGTAFGYSTLWLAAAACASGGHVTTIEVVRHKSEHARDMLGQAGLLDFIKFEIGDALDIIPTLEAGYDMVLLDLWKDLYEPCLHLTLPKLSPGAIIVADNMIQPGGENVSRYRNAVRAQPGMSSVLLPIGTGLEVSRTAG